MAQKLEKMKIKNLDNNKEFDVLFNPTEYTVEDGSKWQDQQGNRRRPELQYTGGDRKRLSMELFFDTYEKNEDVRLHTGKLAKLLVVTTDEGNNGKRPPLVELSWGLANPATGFPFKCVLESLKQQFTLFRGDGTPVRAKVSVSFKEFELPKTELQREPRRGSFPAQTYTVREGDTLSGIAASVWGDPLNWRRLATANAIRNPRILEPGRTLVVPPIE
ncbi:MAG TPA: LysM peptidoglycan-binding domain-containing protein [Pyrinomonadaceae bacterium]|jgi:LysM repeat protein